MIVLKMLADAFHEGGWGMWPILFLLMITLSFVIERAVFLRRAVIDKEKLVALLQFRGEFRNCLLVRRFRWLLSRRLRHCLSRPRRPVIQARRHQGSAPWVSSRARRRQIVQERR